MAKFVPNANVLRAIANRRVGWKRAIAELVDNCFDADAKSITITFDKDALTVRDDGQGAAPPKLQAIVQLGEHVDHDTTELGQYGIGGTESLLWAGGIESNVTIASVHGGMHRRLEVNWQRYARSGWDLPDPEESEARLGERGTVLKVYPLRSRIPDKDERPQILEELGYLYSHAIRVGGRQIIIKFCGEKAPHAVKAWEPPPLEEGVIEGIVHVGNREAYVRAGVVKEGERNLRSGVTYWHGFRVILSASHKGCGDFNPQRVWAAAELRKGWRSEITSNKDGLLTREEELFARIHDFIRPVLERAEKAGSILGLRDLTNRMESRIGAMLAGAKDTKARRGKGSTNGTKQPTGGGPGHTKAAREQAGATFAGERQGAGLKIAYDRLGDKLPGHVKGATVILNLDLPFIDWAVQNNKDEALIPIIALLIGEWASKERANGQRVFRGFEPETVSEAVGRILAANPTLDGRAILRAVGDEP